MTGRVFDFRESLAKSRQHADAPWWGEVYRKAFPSLAAMSYVEGSCPAQHDGVDRLVSTSSGHTYLIDEKADDHATGNFFLEYWSDHENRKRGWVAKDLASDFVAYAFVPWKRCYLLPFPTLRLAWRQNGKAWVTQYRERRIPNKGWTTVGVPVPINVVLAAVTKAQCFDWSAVER